MKTRLFELPVQAAGLLSVKNIRAIAVGIVRAFPGSKVTGKGESIFIETPEPLDNRELFSAVEREMTHEVIFIGSLVGVPRLWAGLQTV